MLKRTVIKFGEMLCIAAMVLGGLLIMTGGAPLQSSLEAGTLPSGDPCSSTAVFPTADPNGTETTTITDALYILTYLFSGGPEPVPPCDAGGDFTPEEVDMLKEILAYTTVEYEPDPLGGDDIAYVRFTECNVQILNGLDATNGNPGDVCAVSSGTETNAMGNLIIGYNESREDCDTDPFDEDVRTGSHNLIVGARHNYSSYGTAVFGRTNETTSAYASVGGGFENIASFVCARVCGGCTNTASGTFSVVCGGRNNEASSGWSVVVGGGEADADLDGNEASSTYAVVVGGNRNEASGAISVVVGGQNNAATGETSTVSGGADRTADGADDWVAGALEEDN